jgi:hypothetical protein
VGIDSRFSQMSSWMLRMWSIVLFIVAESHTAQLTI